MATPDTHNTLVARGYKVKCFGRCNSPCGESITWYLTPAGKWIPYNQPSASASVPYKDRYITPHRATCCAVRIVEQRKVAR